MNHKHIIKQLGDAIRYYRQKNGYSQEYLSAKLKFKDISSYAKIERGEVNTIDVCKLIEICAILDCSLIDLFEKAELNMLFSGLKSINNIPIHASDNAHLSGLT